MKLLSRKFLAAQCVMAAMWVLLPVALPGVCVAAAATAFFVVWALALVALQYAGLATRAGRWTLLCAAFLLTAGIIANIHYFTVVSGGTCDAPVLHNYDARTAWANAMCYLGRGDEFYAGRSLYPLVVASLMRVFGIDIVVPLAANALAVLLTIVLAGRITYNVTQCRRVASTAMILMAAICYFLSTGAVLLKDAPVCLCVATAVCMLSEDKYSLPKLGIMVAVVALLGMVRPQYEFCVIAVALLLVPWRDSRARVYGAAVICLAAGGYMLGSGPTPVSDTVSVLAGDQSGAFDYTSPQHMPLYRIMGGDVSSMTVVQRLLWLPVSVLVQFLVPFPWNFGRDVIYGPTLAYAHFAWPHYVVGGIVLFYLAACIRRSPRRVAVVALLACIFFVATAYVAAGTVSRYALPFSSMFVPAAAWLLHDDASSHGPMLRRPLWRWMMVYAVAMCVGLAVCYRMQMAEL